LTAPAPASTSSQSLQCPTSCRVPDSSVQKVSKVAFYSENCFDMGSSQSSSEWPPPGTVPELRNRAEPFARDNLQHANAQLLNFTASRHDGPLVSGAQAKLPSTISILASAAEAMQQWFSAGCPGGDVAIPQLGSVHVCVRGEGGGEYYVDYEAKRAGFGLPAAGAAALSAPLSSLDCASKSVYEGLMSGKASPMTAFMSGAIKFKGDRSMLRVFFGHLRLARLWLAQKESDARRVTQVANSAASSHAAEQMLAAVTESIDAVGAVINSSSQDGKAALDMAVEQAYLQLHWLELCLHGLVALGNLLASVALLWVTDSYFALIPCVVYIVFAFAGGNSSRRAQLMLMAGIVLLGLRGVRKAADGMSKSDSDKLWSRELRRYARFVFMRTAHFKGLWVKLAQYLSTRADIVPPEFVAELRRVQDAMPATPFEQVRALVVEELQLRKLDSLPGVSSAPTASDETLLGAVFEEFDESPIASASIAQVHRAVVRASVIPSGLGLPQGSLGAVPGEVVVKVQHPGVDVLMRHDIGTLGFIVAAVAWLEPDYDFRPVLDEWAREAAKEVDFSRESRICRHVGKTLFREGLGDIVRVPAMVDLYNRLHSSLGAQVPSAQAAGVPSPAAVRSAAQARRASDASSRFAEIAAAGQSPRAYDGVWDGSDAAAELYTSTAVHHAEHLRLWDKQVDAYSYYDADGKMVHRPYWLWGPTPEAALAVAVQSESLHAPKRILVQEFIKGAGLAAWAKQHVSTYVDGSSSTGEGGGMKAALAPLLELQEQLQAQVAATSSGPGELQDSPVPATGTGAGDNGVSTLPLKVDATALMTSIVRAFAVQMHAEGGVFHGDPHPGNIIVEEWVPADHGRGKGTASSARPAERVRVPRAVLLDFGLSKQLSDSMRVSFARMLVSTASFDVSGLLDAFDDMGLVLNYEDPMRDLGTMAYMYRDVQPRKAARAQVLAQRKKFREQHLARKASQLKKPIESWPADLLFYLRATEMLHGVGSSLGVTVPYMQVMLDTAKAAVAQHKRHEGGHGFAAAPADCDMPREGGAAPPLAMAGGSEPTVLDAFLSVRPSGSKPRPANSDIGWAGWSKKGGASEREGGATVQTHLALAPRLVPPVDGTSAPRGGNFLSQVEAAVFRLLREQHRNGDLVGIQVCVTRAGKPTLSPIVDLAFGQLGEHDPRPMRQDTLVNCFSVTKGVTAAALHLLLQHLGASEGGVKPPSTPFHKETLLDGLRSTLKSNRGSPSVPAAVTRLDAAVAALRHLGYTTRVGDAGWPAFASHGKQACSVAHVLTHQTGLHHALPADVSLTKIVHSEAMEKHLAETEPLFPPGTRTAYQYYTYGWLVQGIIRGLTGGAISVGDIVRHVIAPAAGAAGEMFLGAPLPDEGGSALTPSATAVHAVSHIAHLERAGRLAALSGMLSPDGIMGGGGSAPPSQEGSARGALGAIMSQGGIDGAVAAMEKAAQDLLERHAPPDGGVEGGLSAEAEAATAAARIQAEEMLAMVALIRRIKGREYMLEPRLFNKRSVRGGEIPSANGHFSARGLARFYAALPQMLQPERLQLAASPLAGEQTLTSLFVQGGEGGAVKKPPPTTFGLGFQVYGRAAGLAARHVRGAMQEAHGGPWGAGGGAARPRAIMTAGVTLSSGHDDQSLLPSFGHSGFGGSIALLDGRTGLAVGITVNKLSNGKEATRQVLQLLRNQLGIVDMQAF